MGGYCREKLNGWVGGWVGDLPMSWRPTGRPSLVKPQGREREGPQVRVGGRVGGFTDELEADGSSVFCQATGKGERRPTGEGGGRGEAEPVNVGG